MCIAIVVPGIAAFPALEDLRDMEHVNQDGAGIAWIDRKWVRYLKGLTADEVYKFGSKLTGPRLVHFRMATAGGTEPGLCHPFPIAATAPLDLRGKAKAVMMHNGHWGDFELAAELCQPLPPGPWSDTRLMARLLASKGHKWARYLVNRAHAGKIAVMRSEGNVSLFGHWSLYQGCHYSNLFWGLSRVQVASHRNWKWATDDTAVTARPSDPHPGAFFESGAREHSMIDSQWEAYSERLYGRPDGDDQ